MPSVILKELKSAVVSARSWALSLYNMKNSSDADGEQEERQNWGGALSVL
jgi:hypothetical protein